MEDILVPVVPDMERKKRYLKRYKKNKAQIGRLEDRLISLDQKIKNIKSPNYSGMPKGGVPVSIEELISDKIELEDRIKNLYKKGRILRREILDQIDNLEDERYSEILEAFFIDCLDFDEIADIMGYNKRHVVRLYAEGINALALE